MAPQTVAHPHGHGLVQDIHCLHFTVTGLAENAGADMRPVIEIHMVRQ
jgi:hypothetical protein